MNFDRPHLLAIQDPMVGSLFNVHSSPRLNNLSIFSCKFTYSNCDVQAPDNDIGKNSFNYFKVIVLSRWTRSSVSHFVNVWILGVLIGDP